MAWATAGRPEHKVGRVQHEAQYFSRDGRQLSKIASQFVILVEERSDKIKFSLQAIRRNSGDVAEANKATTVHCRTCMKRVGLSLRKVAIFTFCESLTGV